MIKNLTPHAITETTTGGIYPPSGTICRVTMTCRRVNEIAGAPVYKAEYGAIENLPAPVPGVVYVVSGMVLAVLAGSREDVVAPGELVRNEAGQPIGCQGWKI